MLILISLLKVFKFLLKGSFIGMQFAACCIVNLVIRERGHDVLFVLAMILTVIVLIYNVYSYFGKEYNSHQRNIH